MSSTSLKQTGAGAALAGLVFALTACGGNSDGEYYNAEGQLVIDGATVKYFPFVCPSDKSGSPNGDPAYLSEELGAEGELNDDRTQVMWKTEDGHISDNEHDAVNPGDTEPITFGESGDTVGIEKLQFTKAKEKDALEPFAKECSDSFEEDQQQQAELDESKKISDGTFYSTELIAYGPEYGYDSIYAQMIVSSGSVKLTAYSCDNEATEQRQGTIADGLVTWDDGGTEQYVKTDDGGISDESQTEEAQFLPKDDPKIAEALVNREKECGAFPQG